MGFDYLEHSRPLKGSAARKVLSALEGALARISSSGRIGCAVSGGIDSMVLLHGLFLLQDRIPNLVVLHLNHGLRGEESEGDEAFVREEARRRGLSFASERIAWGGVRPSQEESRKRRFAFFARHLPGPEDKIFLAHHLDDQAETVLLHLLRGSGLRGLAGMAPENGARLRPFLHLPKGVLEEAAREWSLSWREDASNTSTRYERNWLRREILPLLEARRPGVAFRLAELAREAAGQRVDPKQLSFFDGGRGWKLYRREELSGAGASGLSEHFGLSRFHTKALIALLEKGSGRHMAERQNFHLSSGVLLAGKGKFQAPELVRQGAGLCIRTELGSWRVGEISARSVGFQGAGAAGDKVKKIFQQKRVPVFFRSQIPLFLGARPQALLPESLPPGIELELSPLGRWWLTPF